MPGNSSPMVFVDPHDNAYYRDRLFADYEAAKEGEELSAPLSRLHRHLAAKNIEAHTADYLLEGKPPPEHAEYYVFNRLDNYRKLLGRNDVRLAAFMVMEPPAVAPHLYRALPQLTAAFNRVYIHNTIGDGYSMRGVEQAKLRKLYWPQPRDDVMPRLWGNRDRLLRAVAICSNHIPRSFKGELYSRRIEALAALARLGVMDLYGLGWSKWWSPRSIWPPYWLNYRTLMSIYRGPCASKYEVLGRYEFSLCLENMAMKGYLTEKLFDCLYVGAIPLYLGAKDIENLVPGEAFVDCRQFTSWEELWRYAEALPSSRKQSMREAGRDFIRSSEGLKYFNSLIEVFSQ